MFLERGKLINPGLHIRKRIVKLVQAEILNLGYMNDDACPSAYPDTQAVAD